jgi:hypothetical protein
MMASQRPAVTSGGGDDDDDDYSTSTTTTFTADDVEKLQAMSDPVRQADVARSIARRELLQSSPDLARKSKEVGRQIHDTKQLLRTQQLKLQDLNGMGACSETLCFKLPIVWRRNDKNNDDDDGDSTNGRHHYTSKADAMAATQKALRAGETRLKVLCALQKELNRQIRSVQEAAEAAERHYQTLRHEKNQAAIQSCSPAVQTTIGDLEDRDAQLCRDIDHTEKVLAAAALALASLREASQHFSAATDWGVVDLMGGGMMVSAMKHNHLDQAKTAVQRASRGMQQFRNECQELQEMAGTVRGPGGAAGAGNHAVMFDMLLDNIITDFRVQGQITQSAQQCAVAIGGLAALVDRCEQSLATDRAELESCRQSLATTFQSLERPNQLGD